MTTLRVQRRASVRRAVALDATAMDLRAVELLRDPTRMAQLLVRVCASPLGEGDGDGASPRAEPNAVVDDGAEVDDEQHDDAAQGDASVDGNTGGDDDEDDAERLEEENDDDDDAEGDAAGDDRADDQMVYITAADENDDGGNVGERAEVEDDLEAMAAALEVATKIVDELKLKMLVKAGEQLESQGDYTTTVPNSANSIGSNNKPGIPRVKAQPVNNPQCMSCTKSFSAFHRSRNCTSTPSFSGLLYAVVGDGSHAHIIMSV
ncbi:hypothetical protein FI667_g1558, partial [Globisporangium splendens]